MPAVPVRTLLKIALSLIPPEREGPVLQRYLSSLWKASGKPGRPATDALIRAVLEKPGPLENLLTYVVQHSEIPGVASKAEQIGKEIARGVRALYRHPPEEIKSLMSEEEIPSRILQEAVAHSAKAFKAYPTELYSRPPIEKQEAIEWVRNIRNPLVWSQDDPVIGYHVTTDITGVKKRGLRATPSVPRDFEEIVTLLEDVYHKHNIPPIQQVGGLGGWYPGARISMTVSKEAARNILETLPALIKISKKQATTLDFLKDEINRGRKKYVVAFLNSLLSSNHPATRGMPVEGQISENISDKGLIELINKIQPSYKKSVRRLGDDAMFVRYLEDRERMGGPADPIFLSDWSSYQQIDPSNIGVVGIVASKKAVDKATTGAPLEEILEKLQDVKRKWRETPTLWTSPDYTEIKIADPRKIRIFETALLLPLLLSLSGRGGVEQ